MVSFAIRAACRVLLFLLGDRATELRPANEVELVLARSQETYFEAFRTRCLTWVYGDDPRRELEHTLDS